MQLRTTADWLVWIICGLASFTAVLLITGKLQAWALAEAVCWFAIGLVGLVWVGAIISFVFAPNKATEGQTVIVMVVSAICFVTLLQMVKHFIE